MAVSIKYPSSLRVRTCSHFCCFVARVCSFFYYKQYSAVSRDKKKQGILGLRVEVLVPYHRTDICVRKGSRKGLVSSKLLIADDLYS